MDLAILAVRISIWYLLVANLGWLLGVISIIALTNGLEFAICKYYGVEGMNTTDTNMWFDSEDNRINIMVSIFFEKCDEQLLRNIFEKKLPAFSSRFRSRMVRHLDNFYFQELPQDEYNRQIKQCVQRIDNIHNLDQLSEFKGKHQNTTIPDNEVQWKCWVCPDYSADESIIVWKSHHVIGDAMSALLLLGVLQDKYDPSDYIQTTSIPPFWQKLLLLVFKPFIALYALFGLLVWPADKNIIKPENPVLKGFKRNAICKPFSVEKLKKIAQNNNKCTVNDVVLSMASVALKKYMKAHGDTTNCQAMNMFIPFSMRAIPMTSSELIINNNFSGLNFTLPLTEDFSQAAKLIQKKTRKLKSSLAPHGIRAVQELSTILPGVLGQIIINWLISKATLLFSSAPGPKSGLVYEGKRAHGFCALVPGSSDQAFGMTGISMAGNLYYAIQADPCYVENPKEFKVLIESLYDELCGQLKDK